MTLTEIMSKIGELTGEDRAILRRELEEMLSRTEVQKVSPETATALSQERLAAHDERGMPVEDLLPSPPRKEGT